MNTLVRATFVSIVLTLILAPVAALSSGVQPKHVGHRLDEAAEIDLVYAQGAVESTLPVPGASETLQQADVVVGFGKLPLYFVENQGQLDQRVAYYVRGNDKTIYFAPDGVTFVLTAAGTPTLSSEDERNSLHPTSEEPGETANRRWAVKLDFVGANPNVSPIGQGKTEAVVSYFKGSREQWQAGLPTYSRIIYPDLWPGIDLVYYGTVGQLKYEFIVKPSADPAQIRLAYRGASDVALNAAGQLEVTTPIGGFHDDTPVAYQDIDGQRVAVRMAFAMGDCEVQSVGCEYVTGDPQSANHTPHSYGFSIGFYDLAHPLILDPAVLVYCGYIGGNADDWGGDIAVDDAGNVYVTGGTDSTEASFPIMGGPDLSYNDLGGPFQGDVFVAKVNAAGTDLVYVGYIGGNDEECGTSIAVDRSGEAYVTGWTRTTEATFPVTVGPDLSYNSSDFNGDAFVAKVNAAGTDLVYAGYIGGVSGDAGYGIATDAEGNAYVTGDTLSTQDTFPVTLGPDLTYNSVGLAPDAFVAKVNASGSSLIYAGYIGGNDDDRGYDIAVDDAGNAYVTGDTTSTEASFPVTVGPDLTFNGSYDAFVAKINTTGSSLDYAGYIGGEGLTEARGIAVDGASNAYITGVTTATEASFPVTVGPDLTFNGRYDAFVVKVNADGSDLVYAGFIGGSGDDFGWGGIAVDSTGNAYIGGRTSSSETSFPVAGGPDLTHNGNFDAFVAKVNATGSGLAYAGYLGGNGSDYGYGIAVDGTDSVYVTGWTDSTEVSFPVTVGPDLTYNSDVYYSDAFVAKVSWRFVVSGRITDLGANPVQGVSVSSGTGGSAITDVDGNYTLTVDAPGIYTLTPLLDRHAFSPRTRTVSVPPDALGQDFTATEMTHFVWLPLVLR